MSTSTKCCRQSLGAVIKVLHLALVLFGMALGGYGCVPILLLSSTVPLRVSSHTSLHQLF